MWDTLIMYLQVKYAEISVTIYLRGLILHDLISILPHFYSSSLCLLCYFGITLNKDEKESNKTFQAPNNVYFLLKYCHRNEWLKRMYDVCLKQEMFWISFCFHSTFSVIISMSWQMYCTVAVCTLQPSFHQSECTIVILDELKHTKWKRTQVMRKFTRHKTKLWY